MKKIEKPWGFEKLIEINDKYMVKKLFMKKNHRCSLQYHEFKQETIYVLSGKLRVLYGKNKTQLKEKILITNENINLKPYVVHRMEGIEDTYYLESSTPETEDVIRIEDDYKRI